MGKDTGISWTTSDKKAARYAVNLAIKRGDHPDHIATRAVMAYKAEQNAKAKARRLARKEREKARVLMLANFFANGGEDHIKGE